MAQVIPTAFKAKKYPTLFRMPTIADIFGALIERRSYKASMSKEAAYQGLLDMGPKLDRDLVREFRAVACPKMKFQFYICPGVGPASNATLGQAPPTRYLSQEAREPHTNVPRIGPHNFAIAPDAAVGNRSK